MIDSKHPAAPDVALEPEGASPAPGMFDGLGGRLVRAVTPAMFATPAPLEPLRARLVPMVAAEATPDAAYARLWTVCETLPPGSRRWPRRGSPDDHAACESALATATAALARRDTAAASAALVGALAFDHSQGMTWWLLARTARMNADPALAATLLHRAIACAGNNAKCMMLAGRLFTEAGLPARACHALSHALDRNPDDPDARSAMLGALRALFPSTALLLPCAAPVLCGDPRFEALCLDCRLNADEESAAAAIAVRLPASSDSPAVVWMAHANLHRRQGREADEIRCLLGATRAGDATTRDHTFVADRLLVLDRTPDALEALGRTLVDDASDATRDRFIRAAATTPARQRPRQRLPLALVTQIQRSGGTLVSQLLDGHPELFAHPHEIQIGRPAKWHWPALDLAQAPAQWLSALFERRLPHFVQKGYSKADGNTAAAGRTHPFVFNLPLLCAEFLDDLSRRPATRQRDVLDAYFSAYFTAWTDYQPSGRERWFTGFTPRLLGYRESVLGFRRDYPDGLLIACIRDPRSWFVSSSRHDAEYARVDHAMNLWRQSTTAALELMEHRPGSVFVTTYEALTHDTEAEMRRLAARLGIEFTSTLLEPTYLGRPILPNSSFAVAATGVSRHARDSAAMLDAATLATIETEGMALYRDVADRVAAQRSGDATGSAP